MKVRLGEIIKGRSARIVSVGAEARDARSADICSRLMEIGLLEGSTIEVIHEAPFSRDPIAVRVRGTLIALRRNEANYIWVEYDEQ